MTRKWHSRTLQYPLSCRACYVPPLFVNFMKKVLGLSVVLAVAQIAQAADIEAGKELAATVCAECHGATGVSVSDAIPNLAAQRPAYIEAQLNAFKDGRRKHSGPTSNVMNVIPLSAQDIANVAAYFASQPGAATGAKSRPE